MADRGAIEVSARADPGPGRAIRRRVFIEEQDIDPDLEFDEWDDRARHLVATVDDQPAGTARVRLVDESTGKVERVAVLPEYRGCGVGRAVMAAAHEYVRSEGRSRVVVHAQVPIAEFYETLGYERVRPVEDPTDIPHVKMQRSLGGDVET